ncbi:transcriptional regulator [Corynebacterium suranareeae]|uniref:Transcriptional regulator n=1 Tax=Corynebacterium suranareeae TaxID=2506452 RepID=A0A169S022_9CORY|nr:LysR family transcriptional regulator [Corynebacterium suranareeae]BAU96402.1 transcriptional regulator [Corynebacterium suranareeae]
MRIDLRDIELLIATIDGGSITDGAQAVGLSLSAASSRITALEKRFGVNLLHRTRSGVLPTDTSGAIVAQSRKLLEQADLLTDAFQGHQQMRIKLVTNTSAVDSLTEFLAATLTKYPELNVDLEEKPSSEVARQVREGVADLGVVSVLESHTGLKSHPLWADPLVIVSATAKTLEAALQGPMIGLSAEIPLQSYIDGHLNQRGHTPNYRVRLPTLSAVYAVVSTGAGAAILPHGTARRLGARPKNVHVIEQSWAKRKALLLTKEGRTSTEMEQSFVDALLSFRDESYKGTTHFS